MEPRVISGSVRPIGVVATAAALPSPANLRYGRAMKRSGRWFATAMTVTALVMSACTISFGEPSTTTTPEPAGPSAPETDAPTIDAVSAPGRLAVIAADGSLYTVRSDGSDRVDMTAGGGLAQQPAWSPDGARLAWVVQETNTSGVSGSIVVAGPRGQNPTVTHTPFLPYYLSWSPTGDRVAFLGSGGDPTKPVEMGVLDLTRTPPVARAITGGEPFFYFSWAPDGRSVLAHAGFDRLEEIDLTGRAASVSRRPGQFAAPAWSADGRTFVYAERAGAGSQRLVAVTDGGPAKELVSGDGSLSFVLRPDGGAVAYQLLGDDDGDLFDRRPTQPGDGVRVVDLRTGDVQLATSIRAMTFWWSPDGERLLSLSPVPGAPGAIPFLWQVWDGQRASDEQGRHSPTIQVLRDYAPFFTQYAQSTTPWAPDGSAFAFPEEAPGSTGRIVVQEVGQEPVEIGDGVYVTWSP